MANGVRRTGRRVGAVAAWTLAGAVCAGPQAKADVVWDTYGSGYHQGYLSDGVNNRTDAQAFSLAAPTLISEFNWSGAYIAAPVTDDFSIDIYADAGGMPATTPLLTLTSVGIVRSLSSDEIFGHLVYDYSAVLGTPIALPRDTYYISINDVDIAWYWAAGCTCSGGFFLRDSWGPWQEQTGTLVFEIQGPSGSGAGAASVPEPASWLMLGTAILALLGLRRRRGSEGLR